MLATEVKWSALKNGALVSYFLEQSKRERERVCVRENESSATDGE